MSNTQKNTGVSFSKFQAINWHALTMPEPIPLGPGLFMSGDNGKGKSTIMDAFIFLLLADTKNFNEASGMKTGRKRTLKSYVRGYTGLKDEEKDTDRSDYLRPGATVTHVLGELVNRRTGRPLVIGATVEMKDLNVSNEASPVWWYALDTTLADLTFFIHTENGTRVASLSEVKASVPGGKKFVSTSVRRDIRRAYSSKSLFNLCDDNMGDNAAFDRWALVIRSMMACKVEDMKDVSTFVRNYIVPNRPINTSNYDDLLSEQTALADRFERLTKQRDALHDMVTIHDEYRKTKTRQSVAGAAAKRAEELFLERAISKHSDDCEAINRSIQTLENEDTQLEARESGLKEAIMQIRSGQSDEREKTLRRSIKDTRAELQQRTDQQNTYMAGLQAMRDYDTRHASITGKHLLDRDILNELIQAGADGDPAILSKFNSILKEADRDLGFRERELGQTISSIRKTMSAMSAELNDPDRPVGDKNHKAIRTAIQTALRDKGSHGQVFFLCELLDCADESWAPAVEA